MKDEITDRADYDGTVIKTPCAEPSANMLSAASNNQRRAARLVCWSLAIVALILVGRLMTIRGLLRTHRVAGASMAPTLPGSHFDIRCSDCDWQFNCDTKRAPRHNLAVCPNCGCSENRTGKPNKGTRVLIDRAAYWFEPPKRYDIVAYRAESDPDRWEIKRVLGLPGELISVRDGDLFADDKLLRKSLAQLRDVAIVVHDLGFRPRDPTLPARWLAEHSDPEHSDPEHSDPKRSDPEHSNAAWRRTSDGFAYRSTEPNSGEETVSPDTHRTTVQSSDWLNYHHWPCIPRAAPPTGRSEEGPIVDNYAYNQNVSRSRLRPVTDLLLSMQVSAKGLGQLSLRLDNGRERVRIEIDDQLSRGKLFVNDTPAESFEIPVWDWSHGLAIDFGVWDRQVVFSIEDNVLLERDLIAAAAGENRGDTESFVQSLGIGADRLTVEITNVRIRRDLYYLGSRQDAPNWYMPDPVAADSLFVLGDNIPVSIDSRHHANHSIRRDRILGRIIRTRGSVRRKNH